MLDRDPEQHARIFRAKRAAKVEANTRRGVGAGGEETGCGGADSERCEDAHRAVRMVLAWSYRRF